MKRPDRALSALACGGVLLALACRGEPGYRFSAPITIEKPAAFIQLPLSVQAYGRAQQPDLTDLRVVDSKGERVPFAVLAPRGAEAERIEQQRDAVLYPLPPRPAAGGAWKSPVEVTVEGDRISVKRLDPAAAAASPNARSGGWLIDTGERGRNDPPPRALRMAWSGPSEFTAAFTFETSDDLTAWHAGGGGQLMALASASGPLTQATVMLPADPGRFVRLVWTDPAAAPSLAGAKVVVDRSRNVALDPPAELEVASGPEPVGKIAPALNALHFDLGAALAISEIDLRLASGTRVAPVRLQTRDATDQPWSELASSVFYRLERGAAEVETSPPLTVRTRARYLRVVPDTRAAALDPATTKLRLRVELASLVFAAQGRPPFVLLAGSSDPSSSALPIGSLVPSLAEERPRFGRATLGEWREQASVAAAEESRRKMAALRPYMLWAVLLAGVGILAYMVWRLARGGSAGV